MRRLAAAGALVLAASTADSDSARAVPPMPDEQESACMTESHPGVEDLLTAWRSAIGEGDSDGLAALVTEDVEFWSQGQPPLRGREAVREAFAGVFARHTMDQAFRCEELVVIGDWAFMRGLEVNRLTERENGAETTVRQRAFSVMRKGGDGVWRFHRGMTNQPPEAADDG